MDPDDPGKGWFVYFRIYGPEPAAFDGAGSPAILRNEVATLQAKGNAMKKFTLAGVARSSRSPHSGSRSARRRTQPPHNRAHEDEAVIWASGGQLRPDAAGDARKTNGKVGEVIYWGRPLDGKNQTLTPDPDALYFMTFFSTKDGPIVLDLPAGDANGSFNGNIVTVWQMPLEDAGLLGLDKGKGGKYVVLPPGYKDKLPDGFIPLQSDTFGGYALIRSNLKSHSAGDVETSVAYGRTMKVYPLSRAANPPATTFTDVKDITFDSTIRYDASFFEHLDRIVQNEPWIDRDRTMIDQLKSLGIEKGKPFKPDARALVQLDAGVREAQTWLEAKYDAGLPPYWEKSAGPSRHHPNWSKGRKPGSPSPMPIRPTHAVSPTATRSSESSVLAPGNSI